jgi:hypothetical protein
MPYNRCDRTVVCVPNTPFISEIFGLDNGAKYRYYKVVIKLISCNLLKTKINGRKITVFRSKFFRINILRYVIITAIQLTLFFPHCINSNPPPYLNLADDSTQQANTTNTVIGAAIGVFVTNVSLEAVKWLNKKDSVRQVFSFVARCFSACRRRNHLEDIFPEDTMTSGMRDTLIDLATQSMKRNPRHNHLDLERSLWATITMHTPTIPEGTGNGLLFFIKGAEEGFADKWQLAVEGTVSVLGDIMRNVIKTKIDPGVIRDSALRSLRRQIVEGQLRSLSHSASGIRYPKGMFVIGVGIHSPRNGGSLALAGRFYFLPDVVLSEQFTPDLSLLFTRPSGVLLKDWLEQVPQRVNWVLEEQSTLSYKLSNLEHCDVPYNPKNNEHEEEELRRKNTMIIQSKSSEDSPLEFVNRKNEAMIKKTLPELEKHRSYSPKKRRSSPKQGESMGLDDDDYIRYK